MLSGMPEKPQKSRSDTPEQPGTHEQNASVSARGEAIALPAHVAGSGTLDRLVESARDYARNATAENTNAAYKADWAHFSRWCRMRGAEPLPPSPELIGLYIAHCAAPDDGAPARPARPLSVSTIERRLSGLACPLLRPLAPRRSCQLCGGG